VPVNLTDPLPPNTSQEWEIAGYAVDVVRGDDGAGAPNADIPLPSFVQIEPVGQCNLRCRMCPIQFRADGTPDRPPAFIDYDAYCRLVDQFPALSELHLQGLGEPLMHPRFFDMVRYAVARKIQVSTNTNLTLLSERRAEECIDSGLQCMHVSLDGASAETYEFIRVRARFDRVLRNLHRLIDAKRRRGSDLPDVRLVAVVMRRNLHELPDLVRLAHDAGVRTLSVQHLCHDFGEAGLPERYRPMREFVEDETLLREDPERIERYFAQARTAADAAGVTLRLPTIRRQARPRVDGKPRCDWPWRGTYLSYAGDAMPCCMVATPDRATFGNMIHGSVVTVWNNAAYNAFRAGLTDDKPAEICRSCAIYRGTF
jgi:MoaA/NifB/PqqE/SkfB family radical SAM enzyme